MKRELTLPVAGRILELLAPACEEIVVAGSIRRGKPDVGDIEIVALPHFEANLLGETLYDKASHLEGLIDRLLGERQLAYDTVKVRRGTLYKRFMVPVGGTSESIGVDLFLADPHNFGNTLTIRTGNTKFNEALMKTALRCGLRHQGGYLYNSTTGALLPCRTESDFFDALGLQLVPPPDRTDANADIIFQGGWKRKNRRAA